MFQRHVDETRLEQYLMLDQNTEMMLHTSHSITLYI